jgi:hypothetical protein
MDSSVIKAVGFVHLHVHSAYSLRGRVRGQSANMEIPMRPGSNATIDPPVWIDVKEAARQLSVSTRSIWKYIAAGKIETSRHFGRVRVLRSSIVNPTQGKAA